MKKIFLLFFVVGTFSIHNCYPTGVNAYSNRTAIRGIKRKLMELEKENKELKKRLNKEIINSKGTISMWSGQENEIPEGWIICDGKGGTPDLRDKFIVGAGKKYQVDDTGGKNFVKLKVSQMPEHSHILGETLKELYVMEDRPYYVNFFPKAFSDRKTSYPSNSLRSDPTGGSRPHENRPPYYALCFIMKK